MIRKFLVIVSIVSLSISCNSENDLPKEKREFMQAIEKWQNFQFNNYKVTEQVSCFCYGVLVKDVFVQNGVKDKVEFDESDLPEGQTYEDVFNGSKTIEDAFLFIENLLNQDQDPDYMSIEYDAAYGFPTVISVDYDFGVADEEITYKYTNFEIFN